jgi:hypothetical protein
VTASWFGIIPATILGGVGSIVIALIWMVVFPDLRKLESVAGCRCVRKGTGSEVTWPSSIWGLFASGGLLFSSFTIGINDSARPRKFDPE